MIRVIIAGTRTFDDFNLMKNTVDSIFSEYIYVKGFSKDNITVVCGMAIEALESKEQAHIEENRQLAEWLMQSKRTNARINDLIAIIEDMYNEDEINYSVYGVLTGSLNEMKVME